MVIFDLAVLTTLANVVSWKDDGSSYKVRRETMIIDQGINAYRPHPHLHLLPLPLPVAHELSELVHLWLRPIVPDPEVCGRRAPQTFAPVVRQPTPIECRLRNCLVPMIKEPALGRRPERVALGCESIFRINVGSTCLDEEDRWSGRGTS